MFKQAQQYFVEGGFLKYNRQAQTVVDLERHHETSINEPSAGVNSYQLSCVTYKISNVSFSDRDPSVLRY